MSEWPTMDAEALEEGFQMLAWWSVDNPRPKPPELIPGLSGINLKLLRNYWELEVAWRAGRAERLIHGLQPRKQPRLC